VFVEIKSRTWSKSDAENKADRIKAMLGILGLDPAALVSTDYLEMQTAP
jgi:adenylate cyclase class IV